MDRTRRSLVLALVATTACSWPPDLVGVDNPALPAERVPAATEHRLFIMTTREASEATGAFCGAGRAPDLGLASVVVSVPPTHVSGHLERPTHLPPDPSTEFAVIDPGVYAGDAAFIHAIDRELAMRPADQRRLLLFIHGYNKYDERPDPAPRPVRPRHRLSRRTRALYLGVRGQGAALRL